MWKPFLFGVATAASLIAMSLWLVAWLTGSFLIVPVFAGPPAPTPGLEYKDLVAILLTALGVMIAILTLVLAAAAIWGYGQIKEEAARKAQLKAEEVATRVAQETATRLTLRTIEELKAKVMMGEDFSPAAAENGS